MNQMMSNLGNWIITTQNKKMTVRFWLKIDFIKQGKCVKGGEVWT